MPETEESDSSEHKASQEIFKTQVSPATKNRTSGWAELDLNEDPPDLDAQRKDSARAGFVKQTPSPSPVINKGYPRTGGKSNFDDSSILSDSYEVISSDDEDLIEFPTPPPKNPSTTNLSSKKLSNSVAKVVEKVTKVTKDTELPKNAKPATNLVKNSATKPNNQGEKSTKTQEDSDSPTTKQNKRKKETSAQESEENSGNKRAKKELKDEEQEEKEAEGEEKTEFEIDRIEKCRTNKKGVLEFYVHWEGFPDSDNTWQLEGDIRDIGFGPILDEFLKKRKEEEAKEKNKKLVDEILTKKTINTNTKEKKNPQTEVKKSDKKQELRQNQTTGKKKEKKEEKKEEEGIQIQKKRKIHKQKLKKAIKSKS